MQRGAVGGFGVFENFALEIPDDDAVAMAGRSWAQHLATTAGASITWTRQRGGPQLLHDLQPPHAGAQMRAVDGRTDKYTAVARDIGF